MLCRESYAHTQSVVHLGPGLRSLHLHDAQVRGEFEVCKGKPLVTICGRLLVPLGNEAARGRRLQFALDSIPSKSNYDVPMANSLSGSVG